MGKKIVILGGGAGGLVVANKLRGALTRDNEIVLIDKNKNHLFSPSLLWLMVGWRKVEQIQKPLSILKGKGINFTNTGVDRIDFENRTVFTADGDVRFDYLVIALGADTYPEKIPGFSKAAFNLYDSSGAGKIRDAIKTFDNGKLVVLVSSAPYKCPAAPSETALLLSAYFAERGKNVEIELVSPEPMPMGVAGPEVGKMVVSLLQSGGIRYTPGHQVEKIDPLKKEIAFQEGQTISYDFLIGIPPHGVPPVLKDSPLLGKSGWVKVNPKTLETDIENVYALGDVTGIPLKIGKPLPKAGVFAHFQGDVVASRIAAKINGQPAKEEFDGKGYCFIELGDGRAGYASGNFYAEPKPVVNLKKPSRLWHWGKVLFEKWWMWHWF